MCDGAGDMEAAHLPEAALRQTGASDKYALRGGSRFVDAHDGAQPPHQLGADRRRLEVCGPANPLGYPSLPKLQRSPAFYKLRVVGTGKEWVRLQFTIQGHREASTCVLCLPVHAQPSRAPLALASLCSLLLFQRPWRWVEVP